MKKDELEKNSIIAEKNKKSLKELLKNVTNYQNLLNPLSMPVVPEFKINFSHSKLIFYSI